VSIDFHVPPPYWTADLPGIGGRLKVEPEDFEVEEIPAYPRSGAGDFLYLWLQKRAMGAEYFVREIAKRLGIRSGDVGTAGLKDRHAVTRQWVSVPAGVESRLHDLSGDGIELLGVERHGNKLRPGHLRGNRFCILVRDASPDATDRLTTLVERIQAHGMPNFYGTQRFGRESETLRLGLSLIRPEESPDPADGSRPKRLNPFIRKLGLSAVQSALFNLYLSRRLATGFMHSVIHGDVMARWPAGGMFVAVDVAAEQARFDRREIVHTGPIFGKKMFPAVADAAQREADILAGSGIDPGTFRAFGKLLQGTRRHNVVYVDDLSWAVEPSGVRLRFTLPAGSYATVLLREVLKSCDSDDF
jgi:tRNA pseudouridine13 synthase